MEIIKEFAKPRFKYFCTGYYRFGLLTAHKAMGGSYRIKDGFNKKHLNIDLRPSTTSVEEYKAVRRYADLTYRAFYRVLISIN
jgi:hypothetical protein